MATAQIPSKRLYKLAVATLVLGALGVFAWFNWALSDQTNEVNEFQALPPRGGVPVEIDEAGTYTLWASGACNGRCPVPPLDELREELVIEFEAADGTVIRPEPYPGEQSYRVSGDRYGKAAWLVEFDEAGTYQFERRNLGTGSVLLHLGEGQGLSTRITTGIVVIVAASVAVAGLLAGTGWYRERKAVRAMLDQVRGIAR